MTTNSSSDDLFCSFYDPNSTCRRPTEEDLHQIEALCSARRTQGYVLFTIALIFGLPGGILALLTVSRLPLRPSTLYIGLLAISDFFSLVFASLTYYKLLDRRDLNDWEDFSKWFGRIFQAFSHWLLALICIERFVSVRFPLHKGKLYTLRHTVHTCVACLAICCIPFIMFCVRFFEVFVGDFQKYRLMHVVVYLSIYIVLPTLLIVLFTSLMAFQMKKYQMQRRTFMASENSERASKMEADLTRMMFLTALFFVLLTLPMALYHTFDQANFYTDFISFCPVPEAATNFVFYLFASMSFLNHAANFYLYVIGAKGFQRQFLLLFSIEKKIQGTISTGEI